MKDPDSLINAYLDDALDETGQAELRAWLKADPAHLRRFTDALLFDQEVRAAVHARAGAETAARFTQPAHGMAQPTRSSPVPLAVPFTRNSKTSPRLARAAAWLGGITWSGNKAEAAAAASAAGKSTTLVSQVSIAILMKKTLTSIAAAILVLGGPGIYIIHRYNESGRARVEQMETEIQSLSNQLGIKTTVSTSRSAGAADARQSVSITQILAVYSKRSPSLSMQEVELIRQFGQQLAAMDVESLTNLLLDAEKISSPINGRVAEMILKELILKDPAGAAQLATQLIGRGFEFQFLLSHTAADAFKAWLAKDPAAADAWYAATAAAGGFDGKGIAPNGLEHLAIDRSFARLRFAAQVLSDPAAAAATLTSMLPADVTEALKEVTDPDALRQILPSLTPAQKGPAAEGAIKAMAANDLNAAFTWAKSLEMGERERDTLLATGIESAVAAGKLDLDGVAEWSKILDLDAARRANLQVTAAVNSSFVPGGDKPVADWDRVADRTAWLRKEAPPGLANKIVGDYLGTLAYQSRTPDQSFKAYEQEVARQGTIDPALTIAYTFHLGLFQSDYLSGQALKYLKQLPVSQERDEAIRNIETNR